MIPFHAKLLTKFTCHVYLKQTIHESRFFSRYILASYSSSRSNLSRSNFFPYYASGINSLPCLLPSYSMVIKVITDEPRYFEQPGETQT